MPHAFVRTARLRVGASARARPFTAARGRCDNAIIDDSRDDSALDARDARSRGAPARDDRLFELARAASRARRVELCGARRALAAVESPSAARDAVDSTTTRDDDANDLGVWFRSHAI